MSKCTNKLMEKAESQTDIFQICLTCKDNLICPLLNADDNTGGKTMRERLYRGKAINRDPNRQYRTDYKNGDWVFGLLSKYDKYGAEITNEDGVSGIEVDIETIEDYAGIHDKNNKRVFEGDICKNSLDELMIVEWCEEFHTLGFKVVVDEIVKNKKTGKRFYGGWYLLFDCEPNNIEVIGNVHDTPELLEGIVWKRGW